MRLVPFRLAFISLGVLLFVLLVLSPFALAGLYDDIIGNPDGAIVSFVDGPSSGTYTTLHIAITALDENQRTATLTVAGHHLCASLCPWNDRIVLFSVSPETQIDGLPPSVTLDLPRASTEFSQVVALPVRGHPVRFPFDPYTLALGVVAQRVYNDGRVETLSRDHFLTATVQEKLSRLYLRSATRIDPATVRTARAPYEYLAVMNLVLERPVYLRVLTVALIIMIATAAALAVLMRPLPELVLSAGGLILGIWGVRSILVPSTLNAITGVDISLSMVILTLLGAITARAWVLMHDRAELHVLRRKGRRASRD